MSITESVTANLRYCQEVLAVCDSAGMDVSTKYGLIFDQDDSDYVEWLEGCLSFTVEDYEGSDEELIATLQVVFTPMEEDYLIIFNKLKELDK